MSKYRITAINDEYDTCSLCGKPNLKKVAWVVEIDNDGNVISDAQPVGMDCAGKMLKWGNAKTRKAITLFNEYEALKARALKMAKKHGKAVVADWINRLHWGRTRGIPATVDRLVFVCDINNHDIEIVVW